MENKKLIKTASIIVGVILSILVVIVGFNLIQNVFTSASDVEPRDVLVTEKTENSAKITWTTGQETEGVVQYGLSPTSLNSVGQPETQKSSTHSVTLTLLSPATTYYFQILAGGKTFDNGGVPWTFSTLEKKDSVAGQGPVLLSPTVVPTSVLQATPAPSVAPQVCAEASGTNCEAIKSKLGKGCDTQDYFKCVRKLTATPTP
ncbi:hypothetical protein A3G67_00310 [Candidatus Roizmanbacteria bacterium RIFCSPLOWO2_12_FULL_40_12]|nr:MAG: hypothetical protein A2779_02530 [Candidatus Roizmanbacteria bacterium RIFCSPHIGHO2_01_FULL_40_98]OGK29097.1 MAG: hypothetical protein A3C31_03315 [Candidatus Roizmanbacteria bacterium RIFCSPHIGHO2_02_FULL_40_53]OGK29315.1 MAG: hypothetical protein A2W49_05065 [Candidatus Roizmanbacteria bacterium RIFCSPHIGHO2_12_41_18]OGK36014.1 MAG: hypothetical protein A3E69_03155 [Candidatus Roizmanbacteria bacterium RIFCSPHIGHO2_12_FULL_40_130]OGK58505.1 MAG: hypothetical protein A3H84_04570 [Candi